MAFFGITSLGYQEPFQARRLHLERAQSTERCARQEASPQSLPPIGPGMSGSDPCHEMCRAPPGAGPWARSPDHGSLEKLREAVKRSQLQKSPNQLYRVPLTAGQGYGWWMPRDPSVRAETADPWIRTPHYPMISSPMTQFVDQMTKTDRTFSLF